MSAKEKAPGVVPGEKSPPKERTPMKCQVPGCPKRDAFERTCSNPTCKKKLHLDCYTSLVVEKHKVEPLADPINDVPLYACSKTCYNKVNKLFMDQPTTKVPWNKDGKNGHEDPNHSEKIILDWLVKEGNYIAFRGKDNKGTRKQDYAKHISSLIKDAGCRVDRTPAAVLSKINGYQDSFRRANDWANNTGQGVLETDGRSSFEEAIKKRCPFYFLLEPVMKDRASSRPAVTTGNLMEKAAAASKSNDDDSSLSSIESDTVEVVGVAAGETDSKPLAKQQSSASKRSISSVSKSSAKKKRKKSHGDHDLSSLMETIIETQSSTKAAAVAETARHNKVMETMQHEKMEWQSKKANLEYAEELLQKKKQFLEQGFHPRDICNLVPDMRKLFKAHELEDSDEE